jgi:hypothetical protein
MRTMNLDFSWSDVIIGERGAVTLEVAGITPGSRETVKINLKIGPSTLGYIADQMHEGVEKLQATLDEVKRKLRGDPA